ncbi:MAG: hypothetical protein KDE29_07835 [Anaerolineales bacterium]|nr:hypothetical protein [Anaerolineales bacterium]
MSYEIYDIYHSGGRQLTQPGRSPTLFAQSQGQPGRVELYSNHVPVTREIITHQAQEEGS